jgi:hypothetical protein
MGCLKQVFVQIGCLVLVIAALVFGFIYREQVTAVYRRMRGMPPPAETVVYTAPAPGGAGRAGEALRRLAARGGPAYVDLTAGEIAALVDGELRRAPHRALDSLAVGLEQNAVRLRGVLDLSQLPQGLLGPLASGLSRREVVTAGGPLSVDSAGHVAWTITSLKVRDFPFPRGTIPAILRALRIPGAEPGTLPLPLGQTVGDVRVSPAGVRLYRAVPR